MYLKPTFSWRFMSFRGGQEHLVGLLSSEEVLDSLRVGEIQFRVRVREQVGAALGLEAVHYGRYH